MIYHDSSGSIISRNSDMECVVSVHKIKFSSQADEKFLEAMRGIASNEGRQFQAVLDEAMSEYIEKKRTGKPRRHVMDMLSTSMREHGQLYEKLAQ
jgi:hypothetical protein